MGHLSTQLHISARSVLTRVVGKGAQHSTVRGVFFFYLGCSSNEDMYQLRVYSRV